MANDASNHAQSSFDADMTATGAPDHESDTVQLAEATTPAATADAPQPAAGASVKVEIPEGAHVVRVKVAAGESILLPPGFDASHDLAAKEGNGNLAIKVGDVTIILQGYVEAANDPQHPVTVDGSDGKPIDVATVLASTDPNLDIQTAAGPAAGPQGAENGHLIASFGPGAGLDGFGAIGPLDQTALNYKLIDNSIRQEIGPLNPSGSTPGLIITTSPGLVGSEAFLHDPNIHLSEFQGHLTFDAFINGFTDNNNVQHDGFNNTYADFDGSQAAGGDITGVTGSNFIHVDPQNNSTVAVTLKLDGLEAQGLTSNGVALHYELSSDGTTIFAFRGDGTGGTDGALIFVLNIKEGTVISGTQEQFEVDSYLANRIDDTDSKGNPVDFKDITVDFDVTTSADQTGSGTVNIEFKDDSPTAQDDSVNLAGATKYTSGLDVETNDLFGADGKTAGGGVIGVEAGATGHTSTTGADSDIHGQWGTLHLNADGTFTYTRDSSDPFTGTEVDKFTYTIKDGDGDLSDAVLTVNITDNPVIIVPPPPPGPGDNPIDFVGKGTAVFESALSTGSDPASPNETTAGTVKITAADGLGSISIDGTDNIKVGDVIHGKFGDLTITGIATDKSDPTVTDLSYSYTLDQADPNHTLPGNDVLPGEDFKVTASDTDGDKSTGDLTIDIVDDVPTAKDDSVTLASGATGYTSGTNVETNDVFGADGKAAGGGVVGVAAGDTGVNATTGVDTVISGKFGTLDLHADGTFTYTRFDSNPIDGTEVDKFTYTIKDGDGDLSHAVLTVNIGDNPVIVTPPPPPGPGDNPIDLVGKGTAVFESALSTGSDPASPNETTIGTVKITAADGLGSISIDGTDNVKIGTVIHGTYGDLTVTGIATDKSDPTVTDLTYSYTLDKADPLHTQQGNDVIPGEDFKVTASDTDGDKNTGDLVIDIVDDVPTAKADIDTVNSPVGSTTSGNVITGVGDKDSALAKDSFGADGPATPAALTGATGAGATTSDGSGGFLVTGKYGTLDIHTDGSYTYTVTEAGGLTAGQKDVFNYTIKDGDGDTSQTTLTIDANCIPDIHHLTPYTDKGEVQVSESGLPTGSGLTPDNAGADGAFKVDSHGEGFQTVTVGGVDIVQNGNPVAIPVGGILIPTDSHGTMTITAITNDGNGAYDVSYHYQLQQNIEETGANNVQGQNIDTTTIPTVGISVVDKSGDTATSSIKVDVVDDVPVAKGGTVDLTATGGNFNVTLILDLSNSMNDSSGVAKPGGGTYTKLELEKAAIQSLLDKYEAAGNVSVHIVWFNDPQSGGPNGQGDPNNQGYGSNTGGWLSASDALTYVNSLTAQGNTNYDVAVTEAEKSFNNLNGYIANGTNVSYFISDGMPNQTSTGPLGDGIVGVSDKQLADWQQYLDDNNINSYAIGLGTGVDAADKTSLDPLAYDGATTPATDPAGNTIIVTDLGQLASIIDATVPETHTGNLVGDFASVYGADGAGHVNSVSINGGADHSYASTAADNHVLTVDLPQGTITVNMDTGEYTYTPKAGQQQSEIDLTFNLVDSEGDVSNTTTLHLVPTNHAPIIDSNGGGDTASVNVAENTTFVTNVHATDKDIGDTETFSISGGADAAKFTINAATGALSFIASPDFENPLDSGKDNIYDVVVKVTDDHGASDTQAIAVHVTNVKEPPVATADFVYTTEGNSTTVADGWLLANDKGGEGGNTLTITGIPNQSNVAASHSGDTVTLSNLFGGGTDTDGEQASFHYTVSDTKGTADGTVTLTYESSHTIDRSGDTHNDIIIGTSANETLTGGSGHDVIVTGGGTDTVNGGAGFDQVVVSGNVTIDNHFTNIEMVNAHNNAADTITINATDVLSTANVANVGGKDVDLFVTGDTGATKDTVNLNGFSAAAVASNVSFTDPGTNTAHTYDLYQGTGAHTGVIVAVEHGVTVNVT